METAAPTATSGQRVRRIVGRYAFTIDGIGHRLPLPRTLSHNICLAADITVGWGPNASDWVKQRTPFLRAFYRWFWQGACPDCGGAGTIEWVETRQEDGSYLRELDVVCSGCQGSGRDPRLDRV